MTMTANKAKMISGAVERVDLCRRRAVDFNYTHRYSPNTEHYIVLLEIQVRTDDGGRVNLVTPAEKMNVTSGGGAAVVTFGSSEFDDTTQRYLFPAQHPWFREEGHNAVATASKPNDKRLVSKIRVGDRISFKGRWDENRHRYNYVKLVSHEPV